MTNTKALSYVSDEDNRSDFIRIPNILIWITPYPSHTNISLSSDSPHQNLSSSMAPKSRMMCAWVRREDDVDIDIATYLSQLTTGHDYGIAFYFLVGMASNDTRLENTIIRLYKVAPTREDKEHFSQHFGDCFGIGYDVHTGVITGNVSCPKSTASMLKLLGYNIQSKSTMVG